MAAMTDFPAAPAKDALEQGETLSPRFDANGLIAAVATHADTGEVLMLAWMNAEALARTLETGEAQPGMDGGEQDRRALHVGARRDELRQEGDVEDAHLRIQQVGEQAPTHPGEVPAVRPARRLQLEPRPRLQDQVQAQPDEVGRAGPLQRLERQLGRRQQRPKAQRHRRAPGEAAQHDACAGQRRPLRSFHGGGPQHQGGVEARRDGQQGRGHGERQQGLDGRHGRRTSRPPSIAR